MDRHRNDFQKNVHLGDIAVEQHAVYTKLLDLTLCYVPEPQFEIRGPAHTYNRVHTRPQETGIKPIFPPSD